MTGDVGKRGTLFGEDISENVELVISEDNITAEIVIPIKDYSYVSVSALIEENGITEGVDEKNAYRAEKLIQAGDGKGERVIIASGTPPQHGTNGEIILKSESPEDEIISSDDLQKVDYRTYRQKKLSLAKKDEALGLIIKASEGSDGSDIFGNISKAIPGEDIEIELGENVYLEDNKVISTIDGLLEYSREGQKVRMDVSEVLTIKEDVDFSTGNINFPGSVIVKGIIKAGFEVYARNNVVADTVKDSYVEAGGDIIIKQGIIGDSPSKMAVCRAGRNISAKFVQHGDIIAAEDIHIKKSIIHSKILSDGEVVCEGSPGAIIGGVCYGVKGIRAKIIGSKFFIRTEVGVFPSSRMIEDIKNLSSELFAGQKTLKKLNAFLGPGRNIDTSVYDSDKRERVEKLIKNRERLEVRTQRLEQRTKNIKEGLKNIKNSSIRFEKEIWNDVKVILGDKFIRLTNSQHRGRFVLDEKNEITLKNI
ncbi:DUF342 domain-containing protein [Limisalsivibrio acetivorans]|uniref:DUF342 domain-containing protein n=1 Tax=Limisalsivibrio acetivorans TaxID=1304888 RepID=UPI0003B55DD9|nr:FapA family protein [Limisalsivibrio acetivorans]